MKIIDIFKKIEKDEGHKFVINQSYEQKTPISIPNEKGEMVKVSSMILKRDDSIEIIFDDESVIGIAKKHLIKTINGLQYGDELNIGDVIYNINGNKKIKFIKDIGIVDIYDLTVDTDKHLYTDHLGFVHHNTYSVTKILNEMMGSEGMRWVHIKGKLSPLGMYQTFFLNRDKLIVFDDADSVFANSDTINMLKAALDSYDKRTISWISPTTVDVSRLDQEQLDELYMSIEDSLSNDPANAKIKYPNRFDFTGQVIFISNLPASKIDSAVKSRSLTIDVTLSSESVIKRIESIIDKVGGNLPTPDKKEVLDYLGKEYKGELNIRSFVLGCRCKQSGSSNWQRLIKYA
jgi:hypothetical protein